MKGISPLSLACAVLGIALVWSLNRNSEPTPPASSKNQVPAAQTTSPGFARIVSNPAAPRHSTLDNRDPVTLLKAAFAETREIRSMALFMEAMALMNADTLPRFRNFFTNHPLRSDQAVYWKLFYSAWGQIDGTGAIAHIKSRFEDINVQRVFFASVTKTWKDQNSQKSLEFVASFLPENDRENGQLALDYIKDLAGTDIERAIAYGVRLNDPEFVMELTGQRVKDLLKQDFNSAVNALESLTGENKAFATSQFLTEWSTTEPTIAADWISENYYSGLDLQTLSTVASNYVKTDPSAAMAWVYSLPNDTSNAELISNTVRAWASVDPRNVATWLSEFSSSRELDPAVIAYTTSIARTSPSTALEEWVPRISDAHVGDETLYHLAMNWHKNDPEEFTSWLNQTQTLQPIQKQRLLAREYPGTARPPKTPDPRIQNHFTDPALLNNGRD